MAWSNPRTWSTGEVVTAAHMNQEVRDNFGAALPDQLTSVSWTPTLQGVSANYVLTSQSGRRWRVGAMQFALARFVFVVAANQTGSGTMFITLPTPPAGVDAASPAFSGQILGSLHVKDASTGANNRGGTVAFRSQSPAHAHFHTADGATLSSTSPFTFDLDDILTINLAYMIS